jgi:addiction module HigA family antidote
MREEVMAEPRVGEPLRPGRFIELEFLEPLGMTPYALAGAIGVRPPRVYEIVRGDRSITADTALRFARFFGTSAQYWLNLQNRYDLQKAEIEAGEEINRRIEPRTATA